MKKITRSIYVAFSAASLLTSSNTMMNDSSNSPNQPASYPNVEMYKTLLILEKEIMQNTATLTGLNIKINRLLRRDGGYETLMELDSKKELDNFIIMKGKDITFDKKEICIYELHVPYKPRLIEELTEYNVQLLDLISKRTEVYHKVKEEVNKIAKFFMDSQNKIDESKKELESITNEINSIIKQDLVVKNMVTTLKENGLLDDWIKLEENNQEKPTYVFEIPSLGLGSMEQHFDILTEIIARRQQFLKAIK